MGQLVNKSVYVPKTGVIRPVGFAAAELVVEDDWPVCVESLQGLELLVGDAGAAVNDDEGWRVGAVNSAAVDAAAGDGDEGSCGF